MSQSVSRVLWAALALLGSFALGTVALRRGEPISATDAQANFRSMPE